MLKITSNLMKENQNLLQQLNVLKSQVSLFTQKKMQGNSVFGGPGSLPNEVDHLSQTTKTSFSQYGAAREYSSTFEQGNLFMSPSPLDHEVKMKGRGLCHENEGNPSPSAMPPTNLTIPSGKLLSDGGKPSSTVRRNESIKS